MKRDICSSSERINRLIQIIQNSTNFKDFYYALKELNKAEKIP